MKKYYLLLIVCLLFTGCQSKTYKVTFTDNNQELSSIKVKKGENIANIEKPSKEGYLFLNWLKDGLAYNEKAPVTEDITLEASWVPIPNPTKTYTVTFNYGTEIKKMSVKENETVTEPKEEPKKEKHKFIGWYDGDELYDFKRPVVKDFVLTAKFEKNRIVIDYDLKGGVGTVQLEIEKGKIPEKPQNPTKFGYTFTNWTIDGEVYDFDKPLEKDTTLTANYEANTYVEVSYDTDGGKSLQNTMVVSGKTIDNLPVPEKEGYNFLYWTYNDEKFDLNMKITTDIKLKAVYEKQD